MEKDKAAFFAQYYGQVVAFELYEGQGLVNKEILRGRFIDNIRNGYKGKTSLPLKPLSSISDEDKEGMARVQFPKVDEKYLLDLAKGLLTHDCLNISAYQYLQSKGYALPFRGYSVEQMIESGWIKLKDNADKK